MYESILVSRSLVQNYSNLGATFQAWQVDRYERTAF